MAACGPATTPSKIGNTGGGAIPPPLSSDVRELVKAVDNATIVVATMRPAGSKMALLERRVLIGGPPAAVRISQLGDPAVLDALLPLLDDPRRAWAANALLARLCSFDEKIVDVYMTNPAGWWRTFGPTARERWGKFLDLHRDRISWDAESGAFLR
jgi:hypothetical protein